MSNCYISKYMRFSNSCSYFDEIFCGIHRYPEDRVPSFSRHRESMLKDLEDQGWQVRQEDVLMLEKEIEQANTFLVQSQDLRKASEQVLVYLVFDRTGD